MTEENVRVLQTANSAHGHDEDHRPIEDVGGQEDAPDGDWEDLPDAMKNDEAFIHAL